MKDNFLLSRGIRVKEERMRLSLTQQQCADSCGVSRVQWGKYERDINSLDGEVLKRFIAIGADGAYILGGLRSNEQTQEQLKARLDSTKNLPKEDQRRLDSQALQIALDDTTRSHQRKKQYEHLIQILQNFDDELFNHTLQTIDYFENARRKVLIDKVKSGKFE